MIAYNNASFFSITGTAATFSFATTGANQVMTVAFYNNTDGTDVITGVKYNGVSLTQLQKTSSLGNATTFSYLYMLVGAASGTYNLEIDASSSKNWVGTVGCWSGCSMGVQPNASNYVNGSTSNAPSASVTPTVDNCLGIITTTGADGGSASTGVTLRAQGAGGQAAEFVGDHNAITSPAAAITMAMTGMGTRTHNQWLMALAPALSSSPGSAFIISMI